MFILIPEIVSVGFTSILIPLLAITFVSNTTFGLASSSVILTILGVVWAFFNVLTKCLYLELSQIGRTGYYSAVIGVTSAVGNFNGGTSRSTTGSTLFSHFAAAYIL